MPCHWSSLPSSIPRCSGTENDICDRRAYAAGALFGDELPLHQRDMDGEACYTGIPSSVVSEVKVPGLCGASGVSMLLSFDPFLSSFLALSLSAYSVRRKQFIFQN
jgi:hypothetical protein